MHQYDPINHDLCVCYGVIAANYKVHLKIDLDNRAPYRYKFRFGKGSANYLSSGLVAIKG